MYFYSSNQGLYKIVSSVNGAYFGRYILGEWNSRNPSGAPTDFRILFRIKGHNVDLFTTIDGILEQRNHPLLVDIKEKYSSSLKILNRNCFSGTNV